MALSYCQIAYEHREILLNNRPKILYKISPKGTVPVLHLKDGSVIDESIDIMKWALKKYDPDMWYASQLKEQDNLIQINDYDFKPKLDRYKYHIRYPENDFNTYQKDVSKFLDLYENKLKLRQFLISDNVSLADIALMPFIRQCAFVDIDWFNTKFVYLKKWLNKWIDSDLFTKIMVKHETWDDSTVSQIL